MHQMRTVAIDGPVACVSVSLPVCRTGGCVRTDGGSAFRWTPWTLLGNAVLIGVQIPLQQGGGGSMQSVPNYFGHLYSWYDSINSVSGISAQYGVWSHFYTDDSQLYISARPHEAANTAAQLFNCMESMAQWMASNRLKLNPAKTDFLRCATCRRQHQLSCEALMFGGVTIQPSSTVRDLGVILDPELSLGPHINHLVSWCFHQLCRIKSSVRALPTEAAKTVVNSFVVSRLDYCNSLLAGVPQYQLNRLQAVINTAARLVLGVGKFDRIQHLLSDRLHWLPVHKRVQFKLCLLAYKAVHSLAPQYLADFCRPVSSVVTRQRLRSAARDDLVIDRTSTKFGARSFAVAAPSVWNRLPHHIRALQSIDSFKAAPKTYLFDSSWLNTHCCRDNATVVNRMVAARPCNVFVVLRRVRNSRTIIIIIEALKEGSWPLR